MICREGLTNAQAGDDDGGGDTAEKPLAKSVQRCSSNHRSLSPSLRRAFGGVRWYSASHTSAFNCTVILRYRIELDRSGFFLRNGLDVVALPRPFMLIDPSDSCRIAHMRRQRPREDNKNGHTH